MTFTLELSSHLQKRKTMVRVLINVLIRIVDSLSYNVAETYMNNAGEE